MRVADIQRFCMHDGPGVRTTVFLKGCPLRCIWCHNPETQSPKKEILFYKDKCIGCAACSLCPTEAHKFDPIHTFERRLCNGCGSCAEVCPSIALELSGADISAKELLEIIKKDLPFYTDGGGVTLSGGEPFSQSEEVLCLLRLCKENKINTAVETCGHFPADVLKKATELVDLFLWDIKDTSSERHKKNTGVGNEQILSNLFLADSLGARTRLRCILINGINTSNEHYDSISRIYSKLKNCEGVEFIPYHSFGLSKSAALDKASPADDLWIPSKDEISNAKEYVFQNGVPIIQWTREP